jgi:IS6 family transposase
MKEDGELWQYSRLRQIMYLNNIVEQDHRYAKRLIKPGFGFGICWTARRTLTDYDVMAMGWRGQIRRIGGHDMRARAAFVANLFDVAA